MIQNFFKLISYEGKKSDVKPKNKKEEREQKEREQNIVTIRDLSQKIHARVTAYLLNPPVINVETKKEGIFI